MAARVPVDILNDMLIQLPVKSLLRFKCVCRAWKDLIGSSDFIKSHLNRSIEAKSNCSFIFTNYSSFLHQLHDLHSLSFSPTTKLCFPKAFRCLRITKVIGSCNGLICVNWDRMIFENFEYCYVKELAICNPSTRALRFVPYSEEPTPMYVTYGFDYDSESDDYKIVKMSKMSVWVYSMRANSWSHHPKPKDESNYFDIKTGFLKNHFHWIIGSKIYTFDIHDMAWGRLLSLPDCVGNSYHHVRRFGVFDGCLCLTSSLADTGEFEMWVMKEYGVEESWTKLFDFEGVWGIPVEYCEKPNGVLFAKMLTPGLSQHNLWQKTIEEISYEVKDKSIWRVDCHSLNQLCVESLVPLMGNHKLQAIQITKARRAKSQQKKNAKEKKKKQESSR